VGKTAFRAAAYQGQGGSLAEKFPKSSLDTREKKLAGMHAQAIVVDKYLTGKKAGRVWEKKKRASRRGKRGGSTPKNDNYREAKIYT